MIAGLLVQACSASSRLPLCPKASESEKGRTDGPHSNVWRIGLRLGRLDGSFQEIRVWAALVGAGSERDGLQLARPEVHKEEKRTDMITSPTKSSRKTRCRELLYSGPYRATINLANRKFGFGFKKPQTLKVSISSNISISP